MKLDLLIPPPLVALVSAGLIWLASIIFPDLVFTSDLTRWIGFALIAFGLVIDVISAIAFSRSKTTVNPMTPDKTNKLVTGGFYRFTRNPMYLGLLLILLGIALLVGSLLAVLVIIGFVAYISRFQIKPEEEALEAAFGDDFRRYKQKVRRWL